MRKTVASWLHAILRMACLLILSFVFGLNALAGDYELVSISGGQLYSPSQGVVPYSGDAENYEAFLDGYSETGTATGTVTAVFQWNDPTQKPPAVIVSQNVAASFDVINTGGYGSVAAQNDLGDPLEVDYFSSGSTYQSLGGSSGHEYYIVQGEGQITVTITPTMTCTGSGQVKMWVKISIRLLEVELVVTGTTPNLASEGAPPMILQGQGATASFLVRDADSLHGTDIFLTQYSYDVPYNTFTDYTFSTTNGEVYYPPQGYFQTASPHWYWCSPPDIPIPPGYVEAMVSGTVVINSSEGTEGAAYGEFNLQLYRPIYSFASNSGSNNWIGSPYIPFLNVGVRAGPGGLSHPPIFGAGICGQWFIGTVETQSWFWGTNPSDPGEWAFVQLFKGYRSWGLGFINHTDHVLDGTWPYYGPISATSMLFEAEDDPQNATGPNAFMHSFDINDDFIMHQMYLPPGADSRYTPLAFINWKWVAGDTGYFPPTPSGAPFVQGSGDTAFHPTWSDTFP